MLQVKTLQIVGFGYSGLSVCLHLIRYGLKNTKIKIYNSGYQDGLGYAYSVPSDRLLLNVPARNMGAFADDPSGFVRYLERRYSASAFENKFISRKIYGEYLQGLLEVGFDLAAEADVDIEFIRKPLNEYVLDDRYINIIACGNSFKKIEFSTLEVIPAFSLEQIKAVARQSTENSKILILGCGLTMIDQVLLLDEYDYKGDILVYSRHGYLPYAHDEAIFSMTKLDLRHLIGMSLRKILRELRLMSKTYNALLVIDSLRPITREIWQKWDLFDRQKFLARLNSLWSVLRHRAESKTLDFVKKRVQIIKTLADIKSDFVINATGLELDLRKSNNDFIVSTLSQRIIRPCPLGLGIGNYDFEKFAKDGIFFIGSILTGTYFETVAIPDLRNDAARIAKYIMLNYYD